MGGSKIGLWLFLVLSLSAGCPLEDDKVEDGQSNASPADPNDSDNQNGGGSDQSNTGEPGDGNSSEPGGNNGSNGNGNTGDTAPDSGSTGMVDSGTTGAIDASATGGSEDASTTGGDEDSSMSEPDAGPGDAGSPEPDADVGEDAGPPIVVPDLGGASMSDTDRAALIVSYLAAEGYADTWYPILQAEAVQRPLLVTPSHGSSVRAFQNAVAKQASDSWVDSNLPLPLAMPNGSVFVKEMYKVDAATSMVVPNGTLIMAKIDSLDPVAYEGKWFFMRITTANVAARATTCVDCHNGRKATGAWPVNAETNPMGGSPNALVPYDYTFIHYCYDTRTPECVGPN